MSRAPATVSPDGSTRSELRPDARQEHALALTGPLALWVALQLAAVGVAVLRVPLAAQYPEPAEGMAAYLVTGVQVVGAALLFPFLLRDGRNAAVIVASAWPFLLAAGYLAGRSPAELARPAVYITVWLAALAAWAPALKTRRARAAGVAVAGLLALGGAALRYLRLEFAAGHAGATLTPESASPLLSTWANLEGSSTPAGWIVVLGVGGLGIAARVAGRPRREPESIVSPQRS